MVDWMKECEWLDCTINSTQGGIQHISYKDIDTGKKIEKNVCDKHYEEWKNVVYQLAFAKFRAI